MDPIKEAFTKAKQDILSLQSQLYSIKDEIRQLKHLLDSQTLRQTDTSTHLPIENPLNTTIQHINPSIRQINQSDKDNPTHITTDNLPYKALKSQNYNTSTGNEGVSTDRQTVKQTDTSTGNEGVKVRFNTNLTNKTDKIGNLQKVAELVNSLDDLKKELRSQIKRLTNQEMAVFSSIYQLEEEGFTVDYSLLSQKLNLSESSIRDYVQRSIRKGLPLLKTKLNNKKVLLSIPPNLKKVASLATLLHLREL